MYTLFQNTMTNRGIPILPTSLIPSDVAPPPATARQRAPTPISAEDVDEMVVESGGKPDTVKEETTVNLVDGDGATVTEDDETDAAPLTADLLNNTMSLKQLKDRCVELGLATAGKKMDLAERIVASQNGETP
jgi:hypothetical protein